MLKNISKLGSVINKSEQKEINGGRLNNNFCTKDSDCYIQLPGGGVIDQGVICRFTSSSFGYCFYL